ncbi:hypothetical protein PC9H_001801 [Pleurotus ostreatus]|uniref:Nucleoporin protein Ndc1-Nup n=1 Tax=Pleurotus ostreatus TaxID=5322 RepID=A0A8H6ZHC6_PLEOS|nr:uncharacterized protein PC9H_001801 [Pleurotus ostreatus]KAF7419215.1 hypothetical protein PC9H_001801 [Pleurotus ostreatus]KAJ8690037.1 hypothetical protein PTI98_012880 [Pleurotus ostreatus]
MLNSRSGRTPARTSQVHAIPSVFATKTTPTIPSASAGYDPLVKAVLQRRLVSEIFVYSAFFCWGAAFCWSIWGSGGLVHKLFASLLYASTFWIVGALPSIILRKRYVTADSSIANSPSKTVRQALCKPITFHALLTHVASAILIATIHAFVSSEAKLTLFVKSKKHPHYLNGRLIFLLCSQVLLASAFTMRNAMLDRYLLRSSVRQPFALVNIAKTVAVARLLTTITVALSMAAIALAKVFMLPVLYRVPFASLLLRPFAGHFMRSSIISLLPSHHLATIVQAWSLGSVTVDVWEFSNALFDFYVPMPVRIGLASADPIVTLVSGATSTDKIIKQFAYAELQDIASSDSPTASAQRTALFNDQKFMPSLWSSLTRESLITLGHDYQHFIRKGAPAPPPPTAPAAPRATDPILPSTPKKLIQKPIYQSARQSPIHNVIDSLAADGSFAQAIEETHVPDVFRSVTNAVVEPANAAAKHEVQKVREAGMSFLGHLKSQAGGVVAGAMTQYAPARVNDFLETCRAWWTKERLGKVVEGYLPNRQLDVLIVQVLTHLVCASLTEDRYGVVQRDIPKILEAMLSFLSEIEVYQKEVNALYTPPPTNVRLSVKELDESEFVRGQVERAGEVLGEVGDALKDGVASIVRTFGDKLLAFKFPPKTASKLQGFMDYC